MPVSGRGLRVDAVRKCLLFVFFWLRAWVSHVLPLLVELGGGCVVSIVGRGDVDLWVALCLFMSSFVAFCCAGVVAVLRCCGRVWRVRWLRFPLPCPLLWCPSWAGMLNNYYVFLSNAVIS